MFLPKGLDSLSSSFQRFLISCCILCVGVAGQAQITRLNPVDSVRQAVIKFEGSETFSPIECEQFANELAYQLQAYLGTVLPPVDREERLDLLFDYDDDLDSLQRSLEEYPKPHYWIAAQISDRYITAKLTDLKSEETLPVVSIRNGRNPMRKMKALAQQLAKNLYRHLYDTELDAQSLVHVRLPQDGTLSWGQDQTSSPGQWFVQSGNLSAFSLAVFEDQQLVTLRNKVASLRANAIQHWKVVEQADSEEPYRLIPRRWHAGLGGYAATSADHQGYGVDGQLRYDLNGHLAAGLLVQHLRFGHSLQVEPPNFTATATEETISTTNVALILQYEYYTSPTDLFFGGYLGGGTGSSALGVLYAGVASCKWLRLELGLRTSLVDLPSLTFESAQQLATRQMQQERLWMWSIGLQLFSHF